MINLIDFVEESEFNGTKYKFFKPFQCETCGQEFDSDALTVSILLYGVFFVAGFEEGYAGFNCPKCLKTQLLKADIETLRLFYSSIGSSPIKLKYAGGRYKEFTPNSGHHYQSIGQYNLHKLKELTALDFSVSTHCVNQEDWKGFFYDERDMIMNKTMCSSFYFDSHPISGPTVSVLYAKLEDIPKFIKIENDEGKRLIPRYIYSQPIYSLADKFCWDFDFESKHFEEQKAESEKFILNEEDRKKAAQEDAEALQREIDLGYIPADFKSSYHVIDNSQEMQRLKNMAPSQFFSIITQSAQTENISDFSEQDHVACKKIWGKIHPFKDTGVVKYFFNNEAFIDDREVPKHTIPEDETIKEVLELHNKNYGAKFLTENYPQFINDYYKLLNTACCSFREVDDLRRRYLGLALEAMREDVMLEETARIEALDARQYAFFRAGKKWAIKFDGGPLIFMEGTGFQYIHFLVERKEKQFNTDEIANFFKGKNKTEQDLVDKNKIYDDDLSTGSSGAFSEQRKIDEKAKTALDEELERLREDASDAKNSDDPLIQKEAQAKLKEFYLQYKKDVGKKGEIRKFATQSTRNQGSITKAISRALEKIKKYDEKAYEHFQDALKPINTPHQCYKPYEDIDWF